MPASTILESLFERVTNEPGSGILHFCEQDRVQSVTWEEYGREVRRYAQWFEDLGVEADHRVLLLMDSGLEFWFSFLGAQYLGAMPAAVSPPLIRSRTKAVVDKIADVAWQCRAGLIVGRKPYLELAEAIAAASGACFVDAESIPSSVTPIARDLHLRTIAFLQFSSGTTSKPKGVVIDQKALFANIRAIQKACRLGPGDSWATWTPLFHDMGLVFSLAAQEAGAPLYFQTPLSFVVRPVSWLRILSRHRATHTIAPNFAYSYCVHKILDSELEGIDLSGLKAAYNGAETIRRKTHEEFFGRFARFGLRDNALRGVYGMAENVVFAACTGWNARLEFRHLKDVSGRNTRHIGDNAEVASVGVPAEGTRIRIVDDRGNPLPDEQVGSIELTGTSLMRGHLNDDGSLPPHRSEPWWHDTGDLGFVDRGELFFCGRAKDLIIKAGHNIYPDFIEEALASIPEIRKGCVAATGLYNPETGTEDIVVFAEVRDLIRPLADLRQAAFASILDRTGVYVDRIVFLAPYQVQKTTSGKVQRRRTGLLFESGDLELFENETVAAS